MHAHSAKAGLAGRLAVRGRVPTVFQPHAWSFDAVQGREAALALTWERYAARWSTRTLCVSETERRAGEEAGIAAHWSVIRNGIDLRHFRPDEGAARAPARAALPLLSGLPAGAPLVVCVGRLCHQKGQDILLRAWQQVAAAVPGARLVLVGDGPDRERLTAQAPPGVLFAGASRDTRPWLHAGGRHRPALPLGGHGPRPARSHGLRPARRAVRRQRGQGEPAARPRSPLPRTAAGPAGPRGGTDEPADRPRAPGGPGPRGQTHTRSTRDVRKTAAAVFGLYRELVSLPRPMMRKRTER